PGAVIALCELEKVRNCRSQVIKNESHGYSWGHARNWIRDLQNHDGGWPTFCRGWGHLPFDRSGSDLTAHNLRALVQLSYIGERFDPEHFNRLYGKLVTCG